MLHKKSIAAMSFSNKSLIFSVLAVSLLGTYTDRASAVPLSISVANKDTVIFVVSGLSTATGFGGHFSTTPNADGFANPSNPECHFTSTALLCYDANRVNILQLDLLPKQETVQAIFTISRLGVKVDLVRIAINPFTNERTPYTIQSFLPIRQENSFFKTGTIYYQENGVIDGTPSRGGSGYVLDNPIVN